MAFNPFIIKKYAALLMSGFLSSICFFVGLQFYGLMMALCFLGGGLFIGLVIGVLLLRNPFTQMIEGKGILVLNLDSTGIIRPFIVGVHSPYIKGFFNRQPVNDIFDRDAVLNLAVPEKNSKPAEPDNGGIKIILDEKKYNEGRFALFHYPCLLWNDQLKTILTKDFIAEKEKEAFAEHGILYLNRKMEELTSAVRDFGRHVVELTKPQQSLLQNKWFWIILIAGFIAVALLFLPGLIDAFQNAGVGELWTKSAAPAKIPGAAVTPR